MLMWPWISLERESCWKWSLRTSSSQCHNNPVLVPPCNPPDPVKDLYDGQTYDLKKGGYMEEYGCGSSGVWNICSGISLDNVALSVYYWDFLQVVLCNQAKCCSAVMDWSLDQIENL